MILLVDNYESFTYNLAQYLGTFTEVEVLRNDDERLYEQAELADALVFSPGPGWPADAGKMEAMINDFAGKKPMLGICLCHQALAEQSQITFEAPSPIFKDIDNEVPIMRYHSIVVDQMPEEFEVTAITTDDQEIMAIQHKSLPIYGLQYHPESIGSPDGLKMIENFVKLVLD